MYTISKLSLASQSFIAGATQNNNIRSIAGVIAIGRALSNRLQFPSSDVKCIEEYYKLNCQVPVTEKINTLNELLIIDTKACMEYTERFFKLRYQSAYPKKKISASVAETAIEDLFGLSALFSETDLCVIKNNILFISLTVNGVTNVLDELEVKA